MAKKINMYNPHNKNNTFPGLRKKDKNFLLSDRTAKKQNWVKSIIITTAINGRRLGSKDGGFKKNKKVMGNKTIDV